MNEWKNIIMLYKTPIHVLVCKVGRKTYVLLSRFLFWSEAISQITSIFRSYRFLRIAWHDIFSLSHHLLASGNLYIPRVAESKGSWNPIPKVTIVLMWKTPACFKFGQTCNRAVENFLQRKLWVWAANDARSYPPNFLVSFYLSCSWRNAFW